MISLINISKIVRLREGDNRMLVYRVQREEEKGSAVQLVQNLIIQGKR